MNSKPAEILKGLLDSSRGLPEPRFSKDMQIVNWPETTIAAVKQVVGQLEASNKTELSACAKLLDDNSRCGIPDGLVRILSRSLFDNPNTPIQE